MDRRVQRSKSAIKNALINLIIEKDLNEITISEIAEKAGVNRKTFYNCYEGFRDVLEEIEDDIISDFESIVENISIDGDEFNTLTFYENLAMLINEDIDFYEAILNAKDRKFTVKLVGRFSAIVAGKIVKAKSISGTEAETIALFMTSGMLAVFQNWLITGREAPIGEIASTVNSLLGGVVFSLSAKNALADMESVPNV